MSTLVADIYERILMPTQGEAVSILRLQRYALTEEVKPNFRLCRHTVFIAFTLTDQISRECLQ